MPSPRFNEACFLELQRPLQEEQNKLQLLWTKIHSSLKCKSINLSEPSPRRDKICLLSPDLGDACSVIVFLAEKAA